VPVPWAGHFQAKILTYFSNKMYGSSFIKQQPETVMFEIIKMLIAA